MGEIFVENSWIEIVDDGINGLWITIWSRPAPSEQELERITLTTVFVPLVLLLLALTKGPAPAIPARTVTVLFWTMLILFPAMSLAVLVFYLWQYRAVDTVILNDEALILRRELGPIHRSLTFDLAEVSHVRHDPWVRRAFRMHHPRELGFGGAIAFDVRGKTHRFGLNLSPTNVGRILEAVKSTRSNLVGGDIT